MEYFAEKSLELSLVLRWKVDGTYGWQYNH